LRGFFVGFIELVKFSKCRFLIKCQFCANVSFVQMELQKQLVESGIQVAVRKKKKIVVVGEKFFVEKFRRSQYLRY